MPLLQIATIQQRWFSSLYYWELVHELLDGEIWSLLGNENVLIENNFSLDV